MSEIETVTDVEYREAVAGGCCPKGTSELEFLCIIFLFSLPKASSSWEKHRGGMVGRNYLQVLSLSRPFTHIQTSKKAAAAAD